LSLCFINESTIALETSQVARKMFELNRPLFDKINSSTKMLGGALYRMEVIGLKPNINRLLVPINNRTESNEKEISQLFFEDNILRKQQRAITKNGKKIDFDPDLVKDGVNNGFFDPENITSDDLLDMTMVCSVEEISLFENLGVKTILITDNLSERRSLLRVGYRIELNVDTDFREYLDLVIERLDKSIKFLTQYLSNIDSGSHYDAESLRFKDSFSIQVLESLGLEQDFITANLNSQRIKDSEFGQAALSYYNGLLLLSPDVEKTIYGNVLRSLLPTSKSTPTSINEVIKSMSSLLSQIKYAYLFENKQSRSNKDHSKIFKNQTRNNILEVTSSETFEIEKEKLGYSLFSNDQKGLNLFSTADYKTRYVLEQAKYYPKIDISSAEFMTPSEKANFSRIDNQSGYLTPTGLILKDRVISTNRGMTNLNPNDIREYRLAKSARAQARNSEVFPLGSSRARVSGDIMSQFNIQIGRPQKTLLGRTTEQEIDPLVDARIYIGDQSSFATNNPVELLKNFKRILSREDSRILSIVSDIVPRRFLRQEKAIKSIKELQISNKKSLIRKSVANEIIDLASLPPQIKYMCTQAFNPNPNSDPLKNSESREIIEETQKNLFQIRAHVGFGRDEQGFIDIHQPLHKLMDNNILNSNSPILAKGYDYEVPELGIVKDKFAATIYSNLIYIRG
jgi:hypothetical protein